MIASSGNLTTLLDHLFQISQRNVQNKSFRDELIQIILEAYRSSSESRKGAWNICHCFMHLGKAAEAAAVLNDLI